jgi:hypothetical protein
MESNADGTEERRRWDVEARVISKTTLKSSVDAIRVMDELRPHLETAIAKINYLVHCAVSFEVDSAQLVGITQEKDKMVDFAYWEHHLKDTIAKNVTKSVAGAFTRVERTQQGSVKLHTMHQSQLGEEHKEDGTVARQNVRLG